MHWLLKKQLKLLGIDRPSVPEGADAWDRLVSLISETYAQADQERFILGLFVTGAEKEALSEIFRVELRSSETTPTERSIPVEKAEVDEDTFVDHEDAEPVESKTEPTETEPTSIEPQVRDSRKWALLAGMNHALFTPLTDMLGFASILAEESEGELGNYARLIEQSGSRLLGALRSTLDMAQLEAGLLTSHPTRIDLTAFLSEEYPSLASWASSNGLTLEFEHDAEPAWVEVDATSLSRIISNLINAAIRLTPSGGIQIVVQGKEHISTLLLRNDETDERFPTNRIEELVKGDTTPEGQLNGVGLGLWIVRQLVEREGGAFRIASNGEDGLLFVIDLPVRAEPDEPEEDMEADVEDMEEPEPTEPESEPEIEVEKPARPRLLIVEDNRETQILLSHLLKATYDIDGVDRSDEALELARTSTYDAVLLDIDLGERRTGVDVMRLMKELPQYEDVRFVALTAFALPGDREQLLDEGFDGYVGKPFSRKNLIEAINPINSNE